MLREDFIDIEVLPDGTIKIQTDGISQANHVGADKVLALFSQLAGGATTTAKRNKPTVDARSNAFHKN